VAAVTDPSYEPGYRAGFDFRPFGSSAWGASYTRFESESFAGLSVDPADIVVIRSLVVHPATAAADTAFLGATASSRLDFQLIDLEYRGFLDDCETQTVNYVLGGRYADIDQGFASQFTNTTTIEDVSTSIDFEGAGIRAGLEGERRSPTTRLLVYSRGFASLVAGRFQSSYRQTDNFAGVVVATSQDDDRIVPMLDFEVGVGWKSRNERWRFSGGYLISAWLNAVSNRELIDSVQTAEFDDVSDTLVFDGLVGRAEFRF
jgi:hypothetical protein